MIQPLTHTGMRKQNTKSQKPPHVQISDFKEAMTFAEFQWPKALFIKMWIEEIAIPATFRRVSDCG